MNRLQQARKALAAVVGVAGEAVALGILHGTALNVALLVIAGATAAGVYVVPNAKPARITVDGTATAIAKETTAGRLLKKALDRLS